MLIFSKNNTSSEPPKLRKASIHNSTGKYAEANSVNAFTLYIAMLETSSRIFSKYGYSLPSSNSL